MLKKAFCSRLDRKCYAFMKVADSDTPNNLQHCSVTIGRKKAVCTGSRNRKEVGLYFFEEKRRKKKHFFFSFIFSDNFSRKKRAQKD
jgi:hypothetical protein